MYAYPATDFQEFVGKIIIEIQQAREADEGLRLIFSNGTFLDIGFSGGEGSIVCSNVS